MNLAIGTTGNVIALNSGIRLIACGVMNEALTSEFSSQTKLIGVNTACVCGRSGQMFWRNPDMSRVFIDPWLVLIDRFMNSGDEPRKSIVI